jgi:hypothetical protein
MNREQPLDGLDLDHDFFVHDHVRAIRLFQIYFFVDSWQESLTHEEQSFLMKGVPEAFLIRRFSQARAQNLMA